MSHLYVGCAFWKVISHAPEEFTLSADLHVAVEAIADFIESLKIWKESKVMLCHSHLTLDDLTKYATVLKLMAAEADISNEV